MSSAMCQQRVFPSPAPRKDTIIYNSANIFARKISSGCGEAPIMLFLSNSKGVPRSHLAGNLARFPMVSLLPVASKSIMKGLAESDCCCNFGALLT